MPAIKAHKTSVDKTGSWDGPKAVADAPNEAATLRYMHAWFSGSEPDKKASYKFPHHRAGTDTPAVIAGVNNALARLSQAKIPDGDKAGVEAHLRKHRKDAGLEEALSEAEIREALKHIKQMDDLKGTEVTALMEAIKLQEKSNLAEWLESRLHLALTQMADDMFGGGTVTRNERKVLSGAIGEALDSYHKFTQENAPQLFQRRPWEDAPEEDGQPISEGRMQNAENGEIALDESAIALQEQAVRSDGTVQLKIIEPGWGSSGFYSREVLQRDGAKAFPKGTKMNWNHPTPTEEAERPEGDLNDLASEFVNDARWMERGPKGPGLYADAKVFEAYQGAVNDLAPHIGVSIHARGKGMHGEVEGRQGVIVQEIMDNPFNRVDYVTMPGAGGEIISLFEAARGQNAEGRRQNEKSTGMVPDETGAGMVPAQENKATRNVANDKSNLEDEMADEKLIERVATLETNNQALATNNARLAEVLALRDAKDMVKEALAAISTLPDVTKARLVESLSLTGTLSMKDGVLDRDAFAKVIENAVKSEIQYMEKLLGKGQIRGLGESEHEEDEEEATGKKVEDSLFESFRSLGLSEASARIAAKGRT